VLNAVSEREVISSTVAVFAGCCYPVNIYFFYLAAKDGLPQVYKRLGYPQKDDSGLIDSFRVFLSNGGSHDCSK
jgi:hypothetical protein